MRKEKIEIPIFFAVDDGYIPFLAVSIQSLADHASKDVQYTVKVLYTDISNENQKRIQAYQKENIDIEFVDLRAYMEKIEDKLFTRDYYSNTTYFRLFIPNLYPQYDKALYLDCDIVILDDIANLYNIEMKDNLVAAAPDDVIQTIPIFQEYAENVVGVTDYRNYFNAGILLMNLKELRQFRFQDKFMEALEQITFNVAQDQDYLNFLCQNRVTFLDKNWNRMPITKDEVNPQEIKLVHYNLAFKPWHFEDILFKEFFWNYAKKTDYFDEILKIRDNYTEEDRRKDRESDKKLRQLAQEETECAKRKKQNVR